MSKRPEEALDLPKVSFFTSSNLQKIVSFSPDLVLGFSDIQKDIAKDLIGAGLNVWISNHRSVQELLNYIVTLSSMVGAKEEGEKLVNELIDKVNSIKSLASKLPRKPRVYFEEWDEPKISAIRWVSEFIEIAGGEDIFKDKSQGAMANERFVKDDEVIAANPDIVLGCWCGKKFNKNAFITREGYQNINAVKNNQVFEVEPEIFFATRSSTNFRWFRHTLQNFYKLVTGQHLTFFSEIYIGYMKLIVPLMLFTLTSFAQSADDRANQLKKFYEFRRKMLERVFKDFDDDDFMKNDDFFF